MSGADDRFEREPNQFLREAQAEAADEALRAVVGVEPEPAASQPVPPPDAPGVPAFPEIHQGARTPAPGEDPLFQKAMAGFPVVPR